MRALRSGMQRKQEAYSTDAGIGESPYVHAARHFVSRNARTHKRGVESRE